ncbi:FAS1-like dehydratase domain-containing protein [Mycolicibacterium goodii]|uniref:FAS1-like dehydratase domain-containing protein n=1 Tax=Mycolicibacterium goodii TaxID=134601 RepID=UPI001BDCDD6D|nr:MaoC family dehydratase N-terminal domain-containing protein [Mycolicibacterium goodii]MBU8828907.1 hypothetical protein [Mycolicibacterium goodii]
MTTSAPGIDIAALFDELAAQWRPSPVDEQDDLDPARAAALAATLDEPRLLQTESELPAPWQWIYFQNWPATGDLGPDGHPLRGALLPPLPHRTRMFAGARMTIDRPLILGEPAAKTTTVTAVRHKHGQSGHLLFVTVTHRYTQAENLCITEEQDIVYRSGAAHTSPQSHTSDLPSAEAGVRFIEPQFSPASLFRFSALTANSHRIHYDHPYATGTEGYPNLVVHGPLLAMHMASLLESQQHTLRHFEFRLQAPVFLGDVIRIEARPTTDGGATLIKVISAADTVHASARARFTT